MADERHSENWFGDWRDHWWNPDFLALIARRWGLASVTRVLDAGCGVGHWGRALLPHLPAATTLVGIDREHDWVAEATTRATALGLAGRTSYCQGAVEALPFADGSFDLVTCQTVIMHLADPLVGLRELLRVLAPGGRILLAEPNNRANAVVRIDPDDPIEEQLALLDLELRAERGKMALGEGDNSVGERLPGLLAGLGVDRIQAYQADKVFPFVPPYASADERARIDEQRKLVERQLWIADEAGSRRYYLAGGGRAEDFAARWASQMKAHASTYAALERGEHAQTGGAVFYLVSGMKPAPPGDSLASQGSPVARPFVPDPKAFAAEWLDAWNAKDLERVLVHYADDVVVTSPLAARLLPESGGTVSGKAAVRAYWDAALARSGALRFELEDVLAGAGVITLIYRNHRAERVTETLVFDRSGFVSRVLVASRPLVHDA